MQSFSTRLLSLRARDLMSPRVVLLTEEMPLSHAADTLLEQRISGAPVVNANGTFVGLLSLSDLVQPRNPHVSQQRELLRDDPETHMAILGEAIPSEGSEFVRDRMSKQLVSVSEETPLIELSRIMCEGHWHRLAVLDRAGSVVGILSTMDILAALVNAHDEQLA